MLFPRGLVCSCLLSTLLVGAAIADPAAAPPTEVRAPQRTKRSFRIDAADAVQALERFAEQAHTPVIYLIEEVRGCRTNAVAGEFTPREALERMLAHTPLSVGEDARSGALVISRAERVVEPPAKSSEPTTKPMKKTNLLSAVVGWLALTAAPSQYAQAANPEASKQEQPVELSPFVVSSERDNGYAATDTLAGSRLRTPLKDIAASVSVVTKDLLEDLGASNLDDLLVYTTGTEVVGVGGNFSNSNSDTYNQNFDAQRESASPSTRLRGLAGADQTRNFFPTPDIPMDSYNTQSVTINRGANAVLFGIGSPAGIIENSLIAPRFRNKGEVQFQLGSYDSHRQSIDIEHVLVKQKLSLRVAAVNEHREYEQQPSFRDQQRLFGALTFKPFPSTTLRLNAEHGHLDQNLPRLDPPVDSLTTWWDFGKPTRTNLFYGRMPDGQLVTDYQRKNNLDGQAGQWTYITGLVYPSGDSALPNDALLGFTTAPGGISYRHLGPRSTKEVATFIYNDPVAAFSIGRQILDRSIFDYRKQRLDGPNDGTALDFDTQNAALEQLFLHGDAGIELVYDRQKSLRTVAHEVNAYRGNDIFIDVDTVTTDGRPNPNFGRPYIASNSSFHRTDNLSETGRATAFLKHDFSRQWGWLGHLLGTQTLTGLYTNYRTNSFDLGGFTSAVAANEGFLSGRSGSGLPDRQISNVVYLGPSLANAATPAGAHIPGVHVETQVPDSIAIWTLNSGTGYKWVNDTHKLYSFPDFEHLTNSVTLLDTKVQSYAAVLQGDWWDNTLASTLGWRKDTVKTASGTTTAYDDVTGAKSTARPPLGDALEEKTDTFSYGLALHVPSRWLRALPTQPRLSFYFNDSENFQASGARSDIVGRYHPPQQGNTREYGIGLSGFDNRFSVRVTWYRTVQDNITDPRITGLLSRVASLEQSIYSNIPKTTLDALGFVGFDSPKASPLLKEYMAYYNFQLGAVRPDGTYPSTYVPLRPTTVEITNSISKGVEIEGVYNPTRNWRIAFNAARQQAERGGTSPTFSALIADRLPFWQIPRVWSEDTGAFTVQSYAESNIINPLKTAQLSAGEKMPELREWRFNATTRYAFDRNSRLKGWALGGSVRWQDRVALGYPVINDPQLGLVTDIKHPFMGPTEMTFDGLLSYQRQLFRNRIGWKIQLNVYNLLNDNLMIPVKANPVKVGDLVTHENVAYRIGAERTWRLTSTFSF